MVTTRASGTETPSGGDPIATIAARRTETQDPLTTIAARLDAIDDLREKVEALEAAAARTRHRGKDARYADDSNEDYDRGGFRPPQAKIEFPKFSGGDPCGWVLKAEKFFRFYGTREDDKVDVASMYLEGDTLDLFSWIHSQHTVLYWDEFVKLLQEHFGPPEYQNPDEHLCNIRQIGSVQEYWQEWAKRVARVAHWPEHCLLGVFLNGLKDELKADVRIHKPRLVFQGGESRA